MSAHTAPAQLIPGSPRHGVVRYARQLAEAVSAPILTDAPSSGAALHLHFGDRLWGATPAQAAARVETLADAHPLSVTFHDLPQASDGDAWARSGEAYRRVLSCAEAVVCNSRWEAGLLSALGSGAPVTVIPLPVIAAPRSLRRPAPDPPSVGLLGWIYPGKGHHEVITALASCAPAARVVALGGVSEGHDADAAQLIDAAARHGIDFQVTGYLSETALADWTAQVTVPVAAHRHISASGSINTWLSHGRRPLVSASPYTEEMAALRPGTLTLVDPTELRSTLQGALEDPDATWLEPGTDLAPDLHAVAAAYRRFWSTLGRR